MRLTALEVVLILAALCWSVFFTWLFYRLGEPRAVWAVNLVMGWN